MARDPIMAALEGKGFQSAPGFTALGKFLRAFRVEFFYLALAAATFLGPFFATRKNAYVAGLALALFLLLSVRIRPLRRAICTHLAIAKIHRRWNDAIRHCGFPRHIPLRRVRQIEGGFRAAIRVSHGLCFADLERKAEHLAAHLELRDLKIKRDVHNAATGTVILLRTDPLLGRSGEAWPGVHKSLLRPRLRSRDDDHFIESALARRRPENLPFAEGPVSLWKPIPIAMDEHGDTITLTLPERSVLIGGAPGSGKSVVLSILLAAAALDRSARLWLIDGKMVEFAEWEDCSDSYAHSLADATRLMIHLQMVMEERFHRLRKMSQGENRKVKVEETMGIPLHVLFIDELMVFTGAGTKDSKEFATLLTDVVARGRAAGIIPILATQKPEGSVVPTNLRDLIAYRLALRCGTPEMSDTILGRGWAGKGFNASYIAPGEPGVGYLLAEDGTPIRNRSFLLDNQNVRALAARAKEMRR